MNSIPPSSPLQYVWQVDAWSPSESTLSMSDHQESLPSPLSPPGTCVSGLDDVDISDYGDDVLGSRTELGTFPTPGPSPSLAFRQVQHQDSLHVPKYTGQARIRDGKSITGSRRVASELSQDNLQVEGPPSQHYFSLQSSRSPYGQHHSSPDGWWEWVWRLLDSRWMMYGLLLLGIAFATSHHVFYASLTGKPVDGQLMMMMRIGNLLAYISKSAMVSAIVFAYRQQIWATVKRKTLQLGTIDSLFAAADDVTALVNWEFATKAKVALSLATIVWLFPLTAILTPATLTIVPLAETQDTFCSSVRTLNFNAEKTKNWRKQTRINNYPGISLSLWNSTLPNSDKVFAPFNDTFFDYWTGTTWQTTMLSTLSTFADKVVARENASVETCGASWNCSYTISFTGPGYKCSQIIRGRGNSSEKLARMRAPFNTGDLIPDGDFSYIGHTSLGEYYSNQIDAGQGGAPTTPPPFPKHLGAFRTEPVLWIGHSDLIHADKPVPDRSNSRWNSSFTPSIFRCEHYVTKYKVLFNHTLSEQFTTVLSRTYLRPLVNTTFLPIKADDGTSDTTTATPESGYIYPQDLKRYRLTAAYHSLGYQMRLNLNGSIKFDPPYIVANTELMKTQLINKTTYLVVPNFLDKIQALYDNILLSLLANPQFIVVAWASQPTQQSGVGNASTAADPRLLYPCTKTRVANAYAYNARDLWLVYGLAIVLALVSVTLGTAALAQNNNHVRNSRLSSIVAATRAPCFEDLPWKSSKWGEVTHEIRKTRLGYGLITDNLNTPGANVPPPSTAGDPAGRPRSSSASVESRAKVYYGFAPEGIIKRGQGPVMGKASVLSFKTEKLG